MRQRKKILSPMRKNIFLFFFAELKTCHLSYSIWENVVHLKFSRNIIVFKGRAIKCLETRQRTVRILIILSGQLVVLNCDNRFDRLVRLV